MRKLSILLSIFMLFVLSACGKAPNRKVQYEVNHVDNNEYQLSNLVVFLVDIDKKDSEYTVQIDELANNDTINNIVSEYCLERESYTVVVPTMMGKTMSMIPQTRYRTVNQLTNIDYGTLKFKCEKQVKSKRDGSGVEYYYVEYK